MHDGHGHMVLVEREMMTETYCPDCKCCTEVVVDHSAGDTVCSECGLVLEAHSIDDASEWRTFANESADNDPVRVGAPSNPLLAEAGLTTLISKPFNAGPSIDSLSSSLGWWKNRGSNHDCSLVLAFKTIATMCDRFVSFSFFFLSFIFPGKCNFWKILGGEPVFKFLVFFVFFFFNFLILFNLFVSLDK